MLRASRASKSRSPYAGNRTAKATSRPKKQRVTTATQPHAEPENAILDLHQPQTPYEFLQPPRAASVPESTPIQLVENCSTENQQLMQSQQGTIQFDPLDILPNPFISAVSPLAVHLSQSMRDKICNNQFCNFGALLFHDPTSTQQNQVVFEDGIVQVKPKQKEQKISNLSQWLDAFAIFASVYLVKHPTQAIPIFRYMALIKRGAEKVKGNWLDYDIQFRLKKSYNSSLSWASVDAELWMMYMQPSTPSNNVPQQQSGQPRNKCYDFNYQGVCNKPNCNYLHSCLKCSGFHSLVKCYKANSTATSNQPTNSNLTNRSHPHSRNQHFQHPKGRP